MAIRLPSISLRATLVAAVLLIASGPAASEVQVRFLAPEHYTDAHLDIYHGADERVLGTLEQHLQQLGSRCLATGDALEIDVFDIDLAGQQEWWGRAGAGNLRVMREVTWPRIKLAYILRRGNGEVSAARERLIDMNYLWRTAYVRSDSTLLPYERAMLTEWFEQRFCR